MPNDSIERVLDRAVASVRGDDIGPESLWTRLVRLTAQPEAELAKLLKSRYGIAVVLDEDWDASERHETQAGLVANVGGRAYLLHSDPWSAQARVALLRCGFDGAEIALARPGQLPSAKPNSGAIASRPNGAHPTVRAETNVVDFVECALTQGYSDGASDIHFECRRDGLFIRYRLDGVMTTGPHFVDVGRVSEVISRIKVMAALDITEQRRPQDGRIRWEPPSGSSVDLRVSVMPSIFGEDAVVRVLDKSQFRDEQSSLSLERLGFQEDSASVIRELASRPHGLLLVTGPTGSGKTTTVYAALSETMNGLEKVVTIEDPVEYELTGVLQIPVNEQKGLTFATGLRSILRHDPDKILVGEIRDAETAEIAIQSSLTGHLVFTTVHANSLFDVLSRFEHFGIDPFAMTSALNGVVVQRLLRQLCGSCQSDRSITGDERKFFLAQGLSPPPALAQPRGCSVCRGSGYRGRLVVAEAHVFADDVRDALTRKSSLTELKGLVYSDPSMRLLTRGLLEVVRGRTTVEEIRRVIGEAQ